MMSTSLREMRRERWAAQAAAMLLNAPPLPAPQPGLAALLRLAIAELLALLATPRRHAHD
jgi:hypothetical protein